MVSFRRQRQGNFHPPQDWLTDTFVRQTRDHLRLALFPHRPHTRQYDPLPNLPDTYGILEKNH